MLRRILALFGLALKKDLDEYKDFCAESVAATLEAQEIALDLIRAIRYGSTTTDNTPTQ